MVIQCSAGLNILGYIVRCRDLSIEKVISIDLFIDTPYQLPINININSPFL